MRATRPTLAAATGAAAVVAIAMAFSGMENSCSPRNRFPTFIVRNSVPLASEVLHLGRRHHHQPLRRLHPRASWVEETVSLKIPAPREEAYSVYTDLVRQPEWSPWLKSIEHDREKQTSKWVVQQNGVRISWSAVSTLEVPGVEVQWKSTMGLSNRGRVTFEDAGPVQCLMTLTLSYNLPFVIARVLRFDAVKRIVQRTLLSDLERFKDVLSRQPEVIAATTESKRGASYDLPPATGAPQATGKSEGGENGCASTPRTSSIRHLGKAAPGDDDEENSAAEFSAK